MPPWNTRPVTIDDGLGHHPVVIERPAGFPDESGINGAMNNHWASNNKA
jgi:hypothetical protein